MHTQDNLLSEFFKEAVRIPKPPGSKAKKREIANYAKELLKQLTDLSGKYKSQSSRLGGKATQAKLKAKKQRSEDLKVQHTRAKSLIEKVRGAERKSKRNLIGGTLFGGIGVPGTAWMFGGDDEADEGVVDYGKAEEAAPTPEPEAPSGPDPVTYGAGGALLGGGVSHAWGKLAGRPDLARDLIAALGTGIAGATYAATRESNE